MPAILPWPDGAVRLTCATTLAAVEVVAVEAAAAVLDVWVAAGLAGPGVLPPLVSRAIAATINNDHEAAEQDRPAPP